MSFHSFHVEHASKYGINAAVLLQNIHHWIGHNHANGTHFHDGRTWTYNSVRAFADLFPYLTAKQVRTALDLLVSEGVLLRGNYNAKPADRTTWFALTDEFLASHPLPSRAKAGSAHLPSKANGSALQGKGSALQGKSLDRTDVRADVTADGDMSPDGSVGKADPKPARLPFCPHEQIVALYHEHLPTLPAVKLLTDARKRAIRKFWEFVLTSKKSNGQPRATNSAEALSWIAAYFQRATLNDFLMGRSAKAPGHESWECSLDFLLSEKGRIQVIEKTKEAA